MTISPPSTLDLDWQDSALDGDASDPLALCERLRAELRELEPVVSAATLVTVAFRMRDEAGLVAALRVLAQAIDQLERQRRDG
ncbi:MAG: hypothetical protein RMK73_08770 [Geminicoccaceae bacterium]|nr:hypothetical protein [Geminicoccaceae bacterium]MCS7267031.1 hypothetical protein [Geminicoccaceae bacterium]MDW8123348.1 hypothetical protein [Geminicoccaceae bacterium]MDW8341558.1 hypothetical protein [Geminicoccaceae bacterium]